MNLGNCDKGKVNFPICKKSKKIHKHKKSRHGRHKIEKLKLNKKKTLKHKKGKKNGDIKFKKKNRKVFERMQADQPPPGLGNYIYNFICPLCIKLIILFI